jgi:hypothetical protein
MQVLQGRLVSARYDQLATVRAAAKDGAAAAGDRRELPLAGWMSQFGAPSPSSVRSSRMTIRNGVRTTWTDSRQACDRRWSAEAAAWCPHQEARQASKMTPRANAARDPAPAISAGRRAMP